MHRCIALPRTQYLCSPVSLVLLERKTALRCLRRATSIWAAQAVARLHAINRPSALTVARSVIDPFSGCLDPAILRLPHRALHLLNDVAEFDSGQALRIGGLGDGHRYCHRHTA